MRSLLPLSLFLTLFDTTVYAYVFPFHVQFPRTDSTSSLTRRTPLNVSNIANAQYVSNITLGGVTLSVLLDTGSSDLWVHFPKTVPTDQMTDTGKSITLSYAVGEASGNVQTTRVEFGGITVDDQVFLYVEDTSSFTANIHNQGYDGLLGLGPNQSSVIRKKFKSDSANTFLQRAFSQNKTSDNYITVLLDRKNDPAKQYTGQLSISEVVPGFEAILDMPQLDVETVNRLLKSDQHWQALTDKNAGVIGPDGSPIQMKSIVPKAPKGQYVAVVDSGFTFSQVPRDMSDAIYGRVRGAYYDSTNEWWLVPCGQYLNVSFNFGGRNYPIHPLDLVDDNFSKTDATGKKVCIGSFQPITSAFSMLGHYDMILGMSFLRSTYALFDFGNWIGNTADQDHPYMQMLSTVDPVAARKDFVTVRLGGNDTISDPAWALLPVDQMQHSPVSAEEKKKKYQEMILSRWPYIFVGCLAFVLIAVGLCVWRCCRRRKLRKAREAAGEVPTETKRNFNPFSKKAKRESYAPLDASRSTADLNTPYTPRSFTKEQEFDRQSAAQYSYNGYPSSLNGDYRQSQQPYQQPYSHPPQQGYTQHHV
ncbi:hypothetical protein D9613_005969 [Agrocybe pediades]|uniref:Peptidase A1 domain-containing protein n=1 Tax=Agrocybe pediades TaxID=84607 RepID=A0A8H4VNF7_9AGAR|nr:hypothetical protein D9613_005969 [Agrocybe pediades]